MERLDLLRSPRILEKLWLACSGKMISERLIGGGIVQTWVSVPSE